MREGQPTIPELFDSRRSFIMLLLCQNTLLRNFYTPLKDKRLPTKNQRSLQKCNKGRKTE